MSNKRHSKNVLNNSFLSIIISAYEDGNETFSYITWARRYSYQSLQNIINRHFFLNVSNNMDSKMFKNLINMFFRNNNCCRIPYATVVEKNRSLQVLWLQIFHNKNFRLKLLLFEFPRKYLSIYWDVLKIVIIL